MANYKRIDHVAFNVADLEVSKKFYEAHFGFEAYFQHPIPGGFEVSYLKLGDTVLELVGYAAPTDGFHFCLETDDFNGAVSELEAAGVEIDTPPHDVPPREDRENTWRRVVFKGPDGEQIELRG
ncbi:MAG: VOC family protein [Rhodospirillales bacterium]|nr:VOC family protein [Rhodospirillales bacterium]